jgi:CIC family chloride channel protein
VGIHLPSATTRQRLAQFRADAAMHDPLVRLQATMSPAEALRLFQSNNGELWPMFEGEQFTGLVSRPALELAAKEGLQSIRPIAEQLQFAHVHGDHTLDIVLHRMGTAGVKVLPVVSRSDVRRLEGIITLDDILRVFGVLEEKL